MALRKAAAGVLQRLTSAESVIGPSSTASLGAASEFLNAEATRQASNQAVKLRIRAIKNIGKITKAMKMVAASKMRNALAAVETSRGIVDPFVRLFGDHPALDTMKPLTVAVTSDRGLCGGLNSNITKYTKALLKVSPAGEGSEGMTLVSIGDKGRAQLNRAQPDMFAFAFQDTYKVGVTFAQASLIAEELLTHTPTAIKIIFNKFGSAVSFMPTISTVMTPDVMEKQLNEPTGSRLDAYEVEASHERADVLKDLAEFQLGATLFNALLENNCSEHASRMSAMENSTKSAGEMLSKLTLAYNRKRQSTITTELIEIIAGASALVDAE